MHYYSHGSLAYDFTLFEEHDERVKARAKKAKDKAAEDGGVQKKNDRAEHAESSRGVKRARRRKTAFGRIALAVIFGLAILFIVGSIIHGNVQLTELNQEISDAKAALAEQQSEYTQLEMKVDSSISTSVVEQYAKEKLNMSKAANTQKEFINLSDGDKAEVTMTEDKNIFESIADAIASLWS